MGRGKKARTRGRQSRPVPRPKRTGLYKRRVARDITEIPPIQADGRIAYGKDGNQFFDVWRPKGNPARGAAVVIHGRFWRARYDLLHASHMSSALARGGVATASLEYRRVGNPGGG